MKRKPPSQRQILASMIVEHIKVFDASSGELVPLISRDEARAMTADQIISLINVDHAPVPIATAVPLGWGPERYNHPTNLEVKPIRDHREKTAKVDVPAIAKSDRITAEQADFRRNMLRRSGMAEGNEAPPPKKFKRKWPSRPFPKQQRGMNR